MNIIQARHIGDNSEKAYIYQLPKETRVEKGELLLVENKVTKKEDIVIAVADSEDVSKNVLNMIMQGQEVRSKVLGVFIKIPVEGGKYE